MNDYQIIFKKRAADYHYAMQQFPGVRKHEFSNLLSELNFENKIQLLDVPSGGGYLKNYAPENVVITSADFSEGFAVDQIYHVSPKKLPFETASFDAVLSLSGIHHLADVPQFMRECLRVIQTGGSFVFADVKKGTPVAVFLNEFVNTYNSLGHKGNFFGESFFNSFSDIQSAIIKCQYNF